MTSTIIEELEIIDDVDTTKKVNTYVSENVFLQGNKLYNLYFISSAIEFECDVCYTNDYTICQCDQHNWGCNFIRSNKILSCEEKDTILEIYEKIKENISTLKILTREPFIEWICDNVNDIENIYVEIDF